VARRARSAARAGNARAAGDTDRSALGLFAGAGSTTDRGGHRRPGVLVFCRHPLDLLPMTSQARGRGMSKFTETGLTFDDVLLVPAYSDLQPGDAATVTRRSRLSPLDIPLTSAAMDTVTEARVDVTMARQGG